MEHGHGHGHGHGHHGPEVIAIFPPSEMDIEDFDVVDCVPHGDCTIVEDDELFGKSIIDVGDAESHITFFGNTRYSQCVMHVNCGGRFFSVKFEVRDTAGKERTFLLSNKKTMVTIAGNDCTVPMDVGDGWQRLCFDLDDLLTRAFGSKLQLCSKIVFHGACRLAKLYYQARDYADPQLPVFLRVADYSKPAEPEAPPTSKK